MQRFLSKNLVHWLSTSNRLPLILRGARQVGKTWIVRELAKSQGLTLIEINFEKQPKLTSLFETNDIKTICQNIETVMGHTLHPNTSLLFLDEIQAAPELLAKLRWFAEDYPELPVIAAGSLLEFILEQHTFSMPVGRINYQYLGPLSFCEFLHAMGNNKLCEFIENINWSTHIPLALHEKLLALFKEYIIVGGLPAAVKNWIENQSPTLISQIHHDLISTYQDDFNKYSGRMSSRILQDVFAAIPRMLGKKFVYKHVNQETASNSVKNSLDLLKKARICQAVNATDANGIPLGAAIKSNYFKITLLDTGLASTFLGLRLDQFRIINDINLINDGAIAEQVVGQLLQTIEPAYIEPKLYCWRREHPNSSAEIDYVISHNTSIIPIEVKSGKTGSLKSLHLLMSLKKLPFALRINSDLPSQVDINIKTALNTQAAYKLLSIPFYLTEAIPKLLDLDTDSNALQQ